ncbi:hypothetical protein [Citrobacter sp. JGM124]|uniref:hypothetical protein n=1 Tax=Citrobacter sp. JGM124 TaxID=2799789 RepID=UPI0020132058|nr:hypothetical protein [Citrobacter sp. JGM124]
MPVAKTSSLSLKWKVPVLFPCLSESIKKSTNEKRNCVGIKLSIFAPLSVARLSMTPGIPYDTAPVNTDNAPAAPDIFKPSPLYPLYQLLKADKTANSSILYLFSNDKFPQLTGSPAAE